MGSLVSSTHSTAGYLLIVVGLILAIVGIILLFVESGSQKPWYVWLLLILGLLMFVFGFILTAHAILEQEDRVCAPCFSPVGTIHQQAPPKTKYVTQPVTRRYITQTQPTEEQHTVVERHYVSAPTRNASQTTVTERHFTEH